MKPLVVTWPWAAVFWVVFFWVFLPENRIVRKARDSSRQPGSPDAGSVKVIVWGMFITYLAAFVIAGKRWLQFPPGAQAAAFIAGLALLVAGSLLRRHCWRMLGTSFTGDVQVRADQQVVTRGAYAFLRHPSYTAGILLNTGLGIALGSWGSALLLLVGSWVAYSYRIAIEERALAATIGEPYREFMRTRRRLVPFVY